MIAARALLLLTALAGCGDDGSVVIQLDLPDGEGLDPLDDRVTELTVTAVAAGEQLFSATAPLVDGQPLELGRLPVAEQVRFELTGAAASGRIIAFGRSGVAVDVRPDARVTVPVRVRRPFAYVTGGEELVVIDATLEPGQDYLGSLAAAAGTTAAAVTADGAEVVIAGADGLRLVPTASHVPGELAVALPGEPVELAVSADGNWAVTSHQLPEEGIALIDLAALRAGAPADARFVPLARPGAVAIAGDIAWVMVEPLNNLLCQGASTVAAIPLADPGGGEAPVPLGGVGSELVADPGSGAAYAIRACSGGQVVRFAGPGAEAELVAEVEGATSLAVAGPRLWIMGHVDGEGAHMSLASRPLAGGELSVLELPTLEERALAVELEQTGQGGLIRLTADASSAFDMVVLPDGEHVATLVAAIYFGEPAGDAGGGQPIVPAMQMVTFEYQLIELATGLSAQRLRTSCDLQWDPGALLDDFRCALAPGQDQTDTQFAPTDLAVIYGAR